MVRELSPGKGRIVGAVFAGRMEWYRLRYRRLTVGREMMPIGRLVIRSGTRVTLGDRVRIRQTVKITGGGEVHIGSDTLLNGCWIVASDRVVVGDHCLISDCGITDTDFHNLLPAERHSAPGPRVRAAVTIGSNVWIGLRAIVLKGVKIGDNSVVGAGAVVREDVPAGCVVAGNPATVVKRF